MSRSLGSVLRSRRGGRRGFSMAEAAISMVIVGGLLVAALSAVGASARVQRKMTDFGRGALLAQQLMSEIMQQSYEEPVDDPVFGREASESSGSRADYDDVDDYYDWSASPPEDRDGAVIPGLARWGRSVTVVWVSPDDLSAEQAGDTGVKRITVAVLHDDVPVARLTAVRTGSSELLFEIDGLAL